MFLLDVKNSFRNMSRDVLYDSDQLESFIYLERLSVERDFHLENFIFKCIIFVAYIVWCLVKYRMIKIEKYQIYEECFDELLMRFFNFFMVRLQTFVLNI